MEAVITGDIIDSSKYSVEELNLILNTLNDEFECFNNDKNFNSEFKIYRGDSFQGVVLDPEIALDLVIAIKTAVNRLSIKNKMISGLPDCRISIGVGTINLKRDSILESNGEAFRFSGKTLDTMKGDYPRLLLTTANEDLNNEFSVHFSLLDSVMSKWSTASAEVAYFLHRKYKEVEIAKKLNINQSAVNQRKKVANWDSILLLCQRYRDVIEKHTKGWNKIA